MSEKKKEYLGYLIIIVVVVLLRLFIVTPVMVDGTSMSTTLHNNDIMILSKIDYVLNDIERFDIIVIRHNNDRLIKRIIAFPGETVEVADGELYINGNFTKQDFLPKGTEEIDFVEEEPLPKDCYFVMGDNRQDSFDSRYFGCVSRKEILGSANLVIFPFKNFGIKE